MLCLELLKMVFLHRDRGPVTIVQHTKRAPRAERLAKPSICNGLDKCIIHRASITEHLFDFILRFLPSYMLETTSAALPASAALAACASSKRVCTQKQSVKRALGEELAAVGRASDGCA